MALGCSDRPPDRGAPITPALSILPLSARDSLITIGGVTVRNGGFGSAISRGPDGRFYLLTDRGPNYDFAENTKAFPLPRFGPQVGVFERRAGELALVRRIPLRAADGSPLTGLPNPAGPGATGEIAVTPGGIRVEPDKSGLDTEGIHVLADLTFWIAEEYGPSLIHFDADGRRLEVLSPFAGGKQALPLVLARRRPNYGFEGLTGDETGKTLVAILQSPLDNPRAAGRTSVHVRIVLLDTGTGSTKQYLYPLDSPEFSATDIAWLSPTAFLVMERDASFKGGDPPSAQKKVFRIDLDQATDVSGGGNQPSGLVVNGKTVEQLTTAEARDANIAPVAKTLVIDLLTLGYPHDKPEGLVVLGRDEIGVVNDDDFAIADSGGGVLAAKRLPSTGEIDAGALWVIRLPRPLW